jgi:hypothetical protein
MQVKLYCFTFPFSRLIVKANDAICAAYDYVPFWSRISSLWPFTTPETGVLNKPGERKYCSEINSFFRG